ncbi:MAG: sialate O-acetylesterase [Gemmataceae bacterium]
MQRLLLVAALAVLTPAVRADVQLPSVLASHMVLQRDKPLPIWGKASPGEEISVSFNGQKATTKADDKGDWKVVLKPVKADGKAHKMTIAGQNSIELEDILIGEVWVGSGQSNMEWPMIATEKAKERIAAAKHPNIRLFHVPKVQAPKPNFTVKASWAACTPDSVKNFSAVLYYFGVYLQGELDVPIGLINTSWGGSPIEPWTVTSSSSGTMYNAMVAPLMPFAVRGTLWYQGESNAFQRNGMKYRDKMADLITGWRARWGQEMPFLFVQIAPWQPEKGGYPEEELQKLWEAQVASLKIPGTGMAVTTDLVDNIKDIHPQNKRDVGIRLGLWAMAKTYGKKDIVYSGPLYKGMKVEGNKVRLSFAHVGGGLKSRDGKPLSEFEIAGADGKFVPAEAVIDGDNVVVSASSVEKPVEVRFGWKNITNPNLANKEGLPASPFRTKNWQGVTGE